MGKKEQIENGAQYAIIFVEANRILGAEEPIVALHQRRKLKLNGGIFCGIHHGFG